MATNYNLKLNLISDDKKFSAGFRSANNQLKKHQSQVKRTGTSYASLTKSQRLANKYAKEAAVHFGKDSAQFRKAAASARSYKKELDRISMGTDSSKIKGGIGGSIVGVATKRILPLVAIGAAAKGISNATGALVSFEKTMSQVKAVTGATEQEMADLELTAKMVGSSTPKTATDVAKLEVELSKLGFTASEVISSTAGIVDLSVASFSELDETAILVAQTLNAFQLSASKTGEVTDIMAYSFSNSALDLQKLATGLPNVAGAANAFGWSLSRTTGLLGILSDAGIDASKMGTDLRMVITKLAAEGMTLEDSLKQINESTDRVSTAQEIFGQRAFVSAIKLADQIDKVKNLDNEYKNLDGTAKGMSITMQDNVAGSIDKAAAAWEGLVLTMANNSGVIKGFIDEVVRNITKLTIALGGMDANWVNMEKNLILSDSFADAITESGLAFEKGAKNAKILEQQLEELMRSQEAYVEDVQMRKDLSFLEPISEDEVRHVLEAYKQAIREIQAKLDDEPITLTEGEGVIVEDKIIPKARFNHLFDALTDIQMLEYSIILTTEQLGNTWGANYEEMSDYLAQLKYELSVLKGEWKESWKWNIEIDGFEETMDKLDALGDFYMELTTMTREFAQDLLSQGISDVFEKMADSDSEAIDHYGWKVAESTGGFLQQMGAAIMAFGIAETAFLAGDPLTKVVAGAALMAAGAALSGYYKGKQSALSGGGSSSTSSFSTPSFSAGSGYSRYAGVSGHTATGSSSRSWDGESVTFKIKGTDLVGVLDKQSKKTNSTR